MEVSGKVACLLPRSHTTIAIKQVSECPIPTLVWTSVPYSTQLDGNWGWKNLWTWYSPSSWRASSVGPWLSQNGPIPLEKLCRAEAPWGDFRGRWLCLSPRDSSQRNATVPCPRKACPLVYWTIPYSQAPKKSSWRISIMCFMSHFYGSACKFLISPMHFRKLIISPLISTKICLIVRGHSASWTRMSVRPVVARSSSIKSNGLIIPRRKQPGSEKSIFVLSFPTSYRPKNEWISGRDSV